MIEFNHGQRKTVERYWSADRIEWLERQCALALSAGQSPLAETRQSRKALQQNAVKFGEKIQAAIDQFTSLEQSAGMARDVLAICEARTGDIRGSLTQLRNFARHLENELERLGATRKPEERTTLLIRQIAKALRSDGFALDHLETGHLYQMAGLALETIGVQPKDLRRTLRQVLERDQLG